MWEQIRSNQIRSMILVAALGIVLLALGYFLGVSISGNGAVGIAIAVVVWIILNLVAFFEGDSILLSMSRGRKISKVDHPRLYNVVEEMKIASGLAYMPAIYIIDDLALNAFATGRNPKKAAIVITSGLLKRLNRDELQGVIAHELAHIKNRDVLLMSLCSILVGTIILPGEMMLKGIVYSLSDMRHNYHSGRFIFSIISAIGIVGIVSLIFAPILARLIYFAISRRREYLADASGALFTRYPAGLASALEKIGKVTGQIRSATRTTAPMYIVNPFGHNGMAASDLTGTHPSLWERIFILRNMGGGAGLADYERAYEKVHEGGKKVVPAATLAGAAAITAVAPVSREPVSDRLEMARDTSEVLSKHINHSVVDCECGVKLRVPQKYAYNSIKCPRCGRSNPLHQ